MHNTPPQSLIKRVRAMLLGAAALFYAVGCACIFFGGHYLIEISLQKQAEQLLPALVNLSKPLFFSRENSVQQHLSDYAASVNDIGAVRIYDKNHARLLAQYHKAGFKPLPEVDDLSALGFGKNVARTKRMAGIAQSMQVIAPIPLVAAADAFIGAVEIDMDFAPARSNAYPVMMTILIIFTIFLLACVWFFLEKLRRILHPLVSLQEPLHRIAKGDFETKLNESAVDKEIDVIHRALCTTIVALKERELKRNEAVQAIAQVNYSNRQAKENLVNNLSHEIHTPMNGVIGMLDLLLDTELSRTQQEFVNMAHSSAEQLLRRINNMLDCNQLEANQFGLEHVAFDLLREIAAATDAQVTVAKNKGVELQVRYPESELHHLLGNPTRVRQVLSSLVSQTIELTAHGQVILDVQADEQGAVCQLRVAVTSNAMILDEKQQADIFNDVELAARPARQHFGAPQLQLGACKKLVELLGGQLALDFKQDNAATSAAPSAVGFRFSLDLPIAPSSPTAISANRSSEARVLFATEDPAVQQTIQEQLAQNGIRADGFHSGEDALNALIAATTRHDPYHIAILDYQLQGIDGEMIGAAIKSDPNYRNMMLMMVSAEPNAENETRFAQTGFSACLCKPLSPRLFMNAVEVLCTAVTNGESPAFINAETNFATLLAESESQHPFADYRVLIADDNIVNQQVALHLLEKLGCQADIANNGQEAVAMHALQSYDLILMDCQMPVLDGYQATAAIRAKEGDRHTPIIALTAFTMQGEREKCVAAGMDDFLAKPIRLATMRDALERWLNASSSSQTEEVDDFVGMQKMFGADFAALSTLYLTDSPKRIVSLTQAVEEKNAARIAAIAHSLSGSCASIGATKLATLCKELEIQTKADQLDNIQDKLAAIGTEYARVDTKLQSIIRPAEIK